MSLKNWSIIGLLVFALFMVAMAKAARAHGPAQWIQDGAYKNQVGELCCGERDCGFFKSGSIERVDGGYKVDADFQVEFGGTATVIHVNGFVEDAHATPSPTGEYWACVWGGQLKCFFVPPPGS